MATAAKRTRVTKAASAQFQILAALLGHGDLTRDELKAKVDADTKKFDQAIYNAKQNARAVFIEKTSKFRLTKEGREWVNGGANLMEQQSAGRTSPATVKSTRRTPARKGKDLDAHEQQRAGVVHITPGGAPLHASPEREAPGFRCAIFNDGSFFITKGGTSIELDAGEHKQLLHYLERLAEPLAATP